MPPLSNPFEDAFSPSQRDEKVKAINETIKHHIEFLNSQWEFGLPSPQPNESPFREGSRERECSFQIKFICTHGSFHAVREKFDEEAKDLYKILVKKPRADGDVIPRATRERRHPVTEEIRSQLLNLFLRILREHRKTIPKTPTPKRTAEPLQLDDSPIPSSLPRRAPSVDSKRPRDEFEAMLNAKKVRPNPLETMAPLNSMPPPKTRPFAPPSANTSFTSVMSDTESVFSARPESFFANTQSTVPDDDENRLPEKETRAHFTTPRKPETADSSDYASSSFERKFAALSESELLGRPSNQHSDPQVNEELSQGLDGFDLADPSPELILKEKLSKVFPELPDSLRFASTRSAYEITRVFLHAGVSMKDIEFPPAAKLDDYSKLWEFLEKVPALEDKLPEKCAPDVWMCAKDSFTEGFHGIYFSGSLHFDENSVFSLKLDPMRWDKTHRLGRRFGMDRFLELDIPHLTGSSVPKLNRLGDCDRDLIENWLIDPRTRTSAGHSLLGRSWKPFYQKPKERKDKKQGSTKLYSNEPDAANRLYFFAIDGFKAQPPLGIQELLDSFRPTELNGDQPFLKLFARTALVLSRNSATVVLDASQIYRRKDIMSESDEENPTKKPEEMTDGAGRISYSLALKIGQLLALPDSPSGFQARIGEAKGFWSVDYNDTRPGDWIEVCDSQCKWKPGAEAFHRTNSTFEVLRFSGPLKPADLNLQFLPVLMDRAKNQTEMKRTLTRLLESGLDEKLRVLQLAMEDPQTFRQWLRESNANIGDRVKHGVVPYRAALPIGTDERLNMLLDAGFSPHTLKFAQELATSAFNTKCMDLQRRLNITVARSCYVYMIPDFTGTLQRNEVHIDFSKFHDNVTGASNVFLKNTDLLVARSPTHYPSDIQKVKAVLREELIGLKDVIVFSTKGTTSLASKLSGGDYDGDIAWVCWEESIVSNFENAPVPEIPNLVKEGMIKQNKLTYEELIKDQEDPTSTFLKHSFQFNMEQNMLGICTNFKEKVCYTQVRKRYNATPEATRESVYLSTLLSCLVDKSKQGYIFTETDWAEFKKAVVTTVPIEPEYMKGEAVYRDTLHIVDHLKRHATLKIEEAKIELNNNFGNPRSYDDDLAEYFKWAERKAKKEIEPGPWTRLTRNLIDDLKDLKERWTNDSLANLAKEEKAEIAQQGSGRKSKANNKSTMDDESWLEKFDKYFHRYQQIVPHEDTDTAFTQALLPDCFDSGLTQWALLKASALFCTYENKEVRKFPWVMAGRQLACLKAYAVATEKGLPHVVTPHMYAMSKPDAAFVKRRKVLQSAPKWEEENCSIANADEMDDWED